MGHVVNGKVVLAKVKYKQFNAVDQQSQNTLAVFRREVNGQRRFTDTAKRKDMTKPLPITRDLYDAVMVTCSAPASLIPVRGEGSRLWDQEGKEYIDLAGGIAVTCLGHAHPRLTQALTEQAARLWHVSNIMANEPALRLAKKLCDATFAEKVFFANSGAEANEAALKLARKYAADHFGPDKREIIAFRRSFHGRTLFTVTVGGQPSYTKGFEPLPGAITHVPYNDLAVLTEVISHKTCAVIMEPLQGEGGVRCPSPAFVQGVRELCDRHQALLIFDEIQSGFGRTGYLYGYMGLGVTPDILTSAKGLGGGFPIAAMLTTTTIAKSLSVGTHGTTYGGNPLGCAVAEAVLDIVNNDELLTGVHKKHALLMTRLQAINAKYDTFAEIRGQGLLLGCQLNGAWQGRAKDFVATAMAYGVLVLVAGPDVVRMAPSLIIPDDLIEEGLHRFEQAIAQLAG
jgi:acetylornithine/N-succinyldiaminopimelate aminotransferase